jgi:penicillin-binding protein 2
MTARLCNGGIGITPRLRRETVIGSAGDPEGPYGPSLEIPPEHLAVVIEGMKLVSNEQGGTAFRARIDIPGMELAGKTGTAQVRRITAAERSKGVIKNEDLPWDKRDHALFVSFGPVSAPRYACAVVIEHGGGGSAVAAPVARELMLETMKKYIPLSERKIPEPVRRSRAERGRD